MKQIGYCIVFLFLGTLVSCSQESNETQNIQNQPSSVSETQKAETTQEIQGTVMTDEESSPENISASMRELFKKGVAYTCTFQMNQEGQIFDGVLMTDGKKIGTIITSDMQGKKFVNKLLIIDEYSYVWSNLATTGVKMKQSIETQENTSDENSEEDTMNKKFDYSCKKGVDEKQLNIPEDIEFQEMPIVPMNFSRK